MSGFYGNWAGGSSLGGGNIASSRTASCTFTGARGRYGNYLKMLFLNRFLELGARRDAPPRLPRPNGVRVGREAVRLRARPARSEHAPLLARGG